MASSNGNSGNTAQVVAAQSGGYDTMVQLEGSTKQRRLVEVLNEVAPASGAVVDHFVVTNNVGDSATQSDEFAFSEANPPARLLHIPSLESMGYSSDTHKVQAVGYAHLRSATAPTEVEIRLVNADGVGVTGSVTAGEVTTEDSDDVLKTAVVDLSDDAGYSIDMRVTDSVPADVTLSNRALLVRVVKK